MGEQRLPRCLFDQLTMLYRKADGAVAALADRCPHRFAPLNLGTTMGDSVQCGCHGLTFDGTIQCVHNPLSDSMPIAAKVQGWAEAECHDIIWLWGEDRANADQTLIPDLSMIANSNTVKAIHRNRVGKIVPSFAF